MTTAAAQLLDLPSELLLDICSGFNTRTLLRLSHICRAFSLITRPLIFEHQITHLQFWMDLGYLATTPHMKMKDLMNHEDIRLSCVRLNISDSSSWKTLYSCYGLFSRIDYIGCVELQLSLGPTWKNPNSASSGWSQLTAVMNAVVRRPESALTVKGGVGSGIDWPFSYTLAPKTISSSDSELSAVRRDGTKHFVPIGHGFLRHFERFRKAESPKRDLSEILVEELVPTFQLVQTSIKAPPHHLPRHLSPLFHALHICGNQLLRLPLFSWTLDTINNSPITCLTVQRTQLRCADWAYFLQNITIPTLSDLSLVSSQIGFPDLQAFLARHPFITTLNLIGGVSAGPFAPYPSDQFLPRLVELAADPVYLVLFLQPPGAHPDLNIVTMSSWIGITGYEFKCGLYDKVLRFIAQRKQPISFTFLIESETGPYNWLLHPKHPLVQNVTKLEIRTEGQGYLSMNTERVICDWLVKFPSLLHFKFKTGFVPGGKMEMLWSRYKQLETVDCGQHIHRRPPHRQGRTGELWRGLCQAVRGSARGNKEDWIVVEGIRQCYNNTELAQ